MSRGVFGGVGLVGLGFLGFLGFLVSFGVVLFVGGCLVEVVGEDVDVVGGCGGEEDVDKDGEWKTTSGLVLDLA